MSEQDDSNEMDFDELEKELFEESNAVQQAMDISAIFNAMDKYIEPHSVNDELTKKTCAITDYHSVVNYINTRSGKNRMLDVILVVHDFGKGYKYESCYLKIDPMRDDIEKHNVNNVKPMQCFEGPKFMIEQIVKARQSNKKFAYFVIFHTKRPEEEVYHATMVIEDEGGIWRYNSGLTDYETVLDSMVKNLYTLSDELKAVSKQFISATASCQRQVQRGTNACGIYSFYLYQQLLVGEGLDTSTIIKMSQPHPDMLRRFYSKIREKVRCHSEIDVNW